MCNEKSAICELFLSKFYIYSCWCIFLIFSCYLFFFLERPIVSLCNCKHPCLTRHLRFCIHGEIYFAHQNPFKEIYISSIAFGWGGCFLFVQHSNCCFFPQHFFSHSTCIFQFLPVLFCFASSSSCVLSFWSWSNLQLIDVSVCFRGFVWVLFLGCFLLPFHHDYSNF